MVAFAEKTAFHCFACYRVKQSSLPRGKDKPGEGGELGLQCPRTFLQPPTLHVVGDCPWRPTSHP